MDEARASVALDGDTQVVEGESEVVETYTPGIPPQDPPKAAERELTPEAILGMDDLRIEELYVPEWHRDGFDGIVHVRTITASERDRFEAGFVNEQAAKRGKISYTFGDVRARLAVLALVKPDGSQMFGTGDIPRLRAKSARALDRVSDKARELAGMTEDDLKELAEDFDGDQGED